MEKKDILLLFAHEATTEAILKGVREHDEVVVIDNSSVPMHATRPRSVFKARGDFIHEELRTDDDTVLATDNTLKVDFKYKVSGPPTEGFDSALKKLKAYMTRQNPVRS